MKKLFTSLVFLCAALVSYAQPAPENVIAESGPAQGNWKIVKVDDTTYLLKAADVNRQINFQNNPSNNDFKGPNASQNKAALESCTGTLNVEGDFSNVSGFSNNYFGKFETVNLSGMSYAKTETVYIAEYNYQPHDITVGMSYSCQLSNFFKGAKTLTMTPEETVNMQFFNDDNHVCNLVTLNFSTGTKKIVGGDKTSYIEDISSFTTVNFNEGLEEIGDCAFYYGNNYSTNAPLKNATFPSSLVRIGTEAFHGSNLSNANLSGCTSLVTLDYECFEDCQALATVSFPSGSTFTYFGNDAFKHCKALTTVDMSMCDGITEFKHHNNTYDHFWDCTSLTTVILPPNLSEVPGNQGLFKDCSSLATVTFSGTAKYENGAFTNPLVIKEAAFSELTSLTEVNFSNNLLRIESSAFNKCDIIDVELQECHELVEIQTAAFKDCVNMINVDLCSHPKTIRSEAFRNVKTIKKVEIHGCPNTCMTECVCENRGFEYDITHHQTAALNAIEDCALLVFPEDGDVCDHANYTSAWDFFVGDYKKGTLITQENLLCYYRNVPKDGQGDTKKIVNVYDEDGNLVYENGQPKTETIQPFRVECMYQKGNGWHEFINVGFGEVVKKGEFLRTYSRSHGDGPCQLPTEITAYRAVDYKSTKVAWVIDKSGTHYLDPAAVDDPSTTDIDERYVLIPVDNNGVYDQTTLDLIETNGYKRYSYLTVGGILYLRPLWAKVARYPAGGEAQYEGYEGDNIAIFDSEAIYSQLQNVPGKHSYVPENTGVVLYSTNITEDAFLMLPGDFGTATVYKEFPHTGDRFEEGRRNGGENVNTDDDINMLQGSYDTGWTVAPVYPWLYNGQKAENNGDAPEEGVKYTKGHYSYKNAKAYRNFACTKTGESNGKKTYGWQRLQPSVLKVNRAFAQIPVNRFDNFNEGVDQMPDFTIEDMPTDTPSNSLMLIGMFEGEDNVVAADGIKTVNTVDTKVYDNAWYTLQGVRVSKPQMGGVYIHNGQKVVIK